MLKPDSLTTKLRVVFNASDKTGNGKSLNDILHPGPVLQADLVTFLPRWRLPKYVFSCDIMKMYRQIRVAAEHTRFQRILFRDNDSGEFQDYELQTVTFALYTS